MTRYAQHVSTKQTPQSQPIPGRGQVANSAGGFVWQVDCWTRLRRFLVLGNEGGSYYAGERPLTAEACTALLDCAQADPARTVQEIVRVSVEGRAPKNDPAIFALARLAAVPQASSLALAAVGQVCRTGTHLFQFAESVQQFRGWGRGLRRAVAGWYTSRAQKDLAYQLAKYQQRGGWSHRDLLRLSHPTPPTDHHSHAFKWACVSGSEAWRVRAGQQIVAPSQDPLDLFVAMAEVSVAKSAQAVAALIRERGLPRECVPTQWLNDPAVWEALLEKMPLTALVRNLGKMSAIGLLAPLSNASAEVCRRLGDAESLVKARVHPLSLLLALAVYRQGHGDKGKLSWSPVPQVVDALDSAFYLAFCAVQPTNKRWLLALDVSGSMGCSYVAGTRLSCREASAAMALVTANVEPRHAFFGFSTRFVPLAISAKQRLDDAVRASSRLPFEATDCSLPMRHALQHKLPVDVFVVYTDNETWAGPIHPSQALREYREKTGIPARLIVVGMVANNFTIADPHDAGMLDVVGFDTTVPEVMRDFAD